MRSLPFKKIDAFTGASSTGNPAGVVYLNEAGELSPEEMQEIAGACRGWVSEVGFVAKLVPGRYWLRYYSSEREVDFCGHATVAVAYDLIRNDRSLMTGSLVRFCTKTAEVEALNRLQAEDAVYISAPPPVPRQLRVSNGECAAALRVGSAGNIQTRALINAGLDTLIVEAASLDIVLGLAPDLRQLAEFCVSGGIDILLVFADEVSTPGCAYRTRVFAPRYGYLEDPATGSGNSAFGNYLFARQQWTEGVLTVEQNGSKERPNFVKLVLDRKTDGSVGVMFGGSARVKLQGEYFL